MPTLIFVELPLLPCALQNYLLKLIHSDSREGFCKYGRECIKQDLDTKGEGVGLTVISACDSSLQQHEDQSLVLMTKAFTKTCNGKLPLSIPAWTTQSTPASGFQPSCKIMFYSCIQAICELKRWSITSVGFDNMIVAGSCFTLVSEQQGAINIPQILFHWHKRWMRQLKN